MTTYDREKYILEDSPLKKNLLKLFNPNSRLNILDIGGCEGEESLRYSRIFPYASIYTFEPLPKNQKRIIENIEKFKAENVKLFPVAVSDEVGSASFHMSSGHPKHEPDNLDWDFGNKSSSLLVPEKDNNPEWLSFDKEITVKTITLESFFNEQEINEVDFIHMDVQGAELKVLNGAKGFLKNIKVIWLEVSDIELYKSQPLRNDIVSFMNSNGFKLVKSEMEDQIGDQLYLNKRYFKSFSIFSKRFSFKIKK